MRSAEAMNTRRLMVVLLVCLGAALAAPATAFAHVANIEYRFPLPVWLYGVAGAFVVLVSAPAAVLAVRREPRVGKRNLYPTVSRFFPTRVLRAVALALLVWVIVTGLMRKTIGLENPAVLIVFVDFWVGLGVVSALVGNVWDFVSPFRTIGNWLDGALARRGMEGRVYPAGLGLTPAFVQLLVFAWIELIWKDGDEPRTLGLLVLAYCIVQIVGMAVFSTEIWLSRAELFTVFARVMARTAPFEFYVRASDDCRAGRCYDTPERIGCISCFEDATSGDRGLRLRPYGAGILREPPLGPGGGAFVVALLATVVYDGLRGTGQYARLERRIVEAVPDLRSAEELRGTITMILVVGAFAAVYLLACSLASLFEEGGIVDVAERYAPTLIPIAAVYFIAHYILYLFYAGQLTPAVVIDPTGRDFLEYRPWTGVPGSVVWTIQLGLIVVGHVIAVMQAHRVAQPLHRTRRGLLLAQVPLLSLMVLYTFTGLWVLGQALNQA